MKGRFITVNVRSITGGIAARALFGSAMSASRKGVARLLGAAVLSALGGCADTGIAVPGSSEYSCAGLPEGVVCRSTRDIYALTEDRDRVHAADIADPVGVGAGGERILVGPDGVTSPIDVASGAAPGGPAAPASLAGAPREGVIAFAQGSPAPVNDPRGLALAAARAPQRQDAKVVRIWIAPWQDQRGDLRMPGHVFAEVQPRSWSFGAPVVEPPASNLLMTPEMIRARDDAAAPPAGVPLGVGAPAAAPVGAPAPAGPSRRTPQFEPPRTIEVRS